MKYLILLSAAIIAIGLLFLRLPKQTDFQSSEVNREHTEQNHSQDLAVNQSSESPIPPSAKQDKDSYVLDGSEAIRVSKIPDLLVDLKVRNFLLNNNIKIGPSDTIELVKLFQETHLIQSVFERDIMEVSKSDSGNIDVFVPAYPESGSDIRDLFTSRLADILSQDVPTGWAESILEYASKDFSDFGDSPKRFIIENVGLRDGEKTYKITILNYGPNYTEGQQPIKMSQDHATLDDMAGGKFESLYHILTKV